MGEGKSMQVGRKRKGDGKLHEKQERETERENSGGDEEARR